MNPQAPPTTPFGLIPPALDALAAALQGELHTGELMRAIYATDASAYEEMPLAVAIPKTKRDLVALIRIATEHGLGLIPRTAGTSLAGQVVGSGIVIDLSRHFTRILEIDAAEGWARVEPGVIRNELNLALAPYDLLFGPETSTQNRAMLGGMLGNNSCGSNSVRYGSVRDHVLEVTALLHDGSEAVFGPLGPEEFAAKCEGDSAESKLYRQIRSLLSDAGVREGIRREFPKPSIHRRNTGYALDLLMDAACFDPASERPFHFGKLIAGSEGTLCLVTEMKLRCVPLPPPVAGLQCSHFDSVEASLRAVRFALDEDCHACELIDHFILECTERSLEHRENRFFLEGKPGAVLVTELRGESREEVLAATARLEARMRAAGLGYAWPVLFGSDANRIWDLRKAGLGLMNNVPGDEKPVAVIEDTAVAVEDLPDYIAEFNRVLEAEFGIRCVHYAHAGSGEIHLRPVLNLKTEEGRRVFRAVAETVAGLVKKYRGSLSGEHGDGRLRGEFLERMIGPENLRLLRAVKAAWDPKGIFNPGKIVETPPMDASLRYGPGQPEREIETYFDWSETHGVLRAAEMCNGSGDCRKTHLSGGTMCPSYMATRDEKDTTRARANRLRQVLTASPKSNPFDDESLAEVLDLCLSCKGCKKECPSTVDMAKLKAEFQQHWHDARGAPLRSRMIAAFPATQRIAAKAPWLWNAVFGTPALRRLANRCVGFHPERSIPLMPRQTFARWFARHAPNAEAGRAGRVWLCPDEFTEGADAAVGIAAVELLEALGYAVDLAPVSASGRTWLSKGFLREARAVLDANLLALDGLVSESRPLLGVEPSGILTYRDEVLSLASPEHRATARRIAPHCLMVEEFLAREIAAGRIGPERFTRDERTVRLHGHCFQKALAGTAATVAALSLPEHYRVVEIKSGCCGMAGSFGYEREHYELSQQIGALVLFPAIAKADESDLIAAPGTSCRHQIRDGTGRAARHPVEILRKALEAGPSRLGQRSKPI